MVARVWHEIEVGNKESNHKINGIERYASGYKMYAFTAINAVFGVLWCGVVCACVEIEKSIQCALMLQKWPL